MSALPPKADIRPGAQNVRLVPKADIQTDRGQRIWSTTEPENFGQSFLYLGHIGHTDCPGVSAEPYGTRLRMVVHVADRAAA